VAPQVKIGPVVDAFEFLPPERVLVFDVPRRFGVVSEFIVGVFTPAEFGHVYPQPRVPVPALFAPVLHPLGVLAGVDEKLHFHLLELARAEDEIARRDFVAERLADLRNPNGIFCREEFFNSEN